MYVGLPVPAPSGELVVVIVNRVVPGSLDGGADVGAVVSGVDDDDVTNSVVPGAGNMVGIMILGGVEVDDVSTLGVVSGLVNAGGATVRVEIEVTVAVGLVTVVTVRKGLLRRPFPFPLKSPGGGGGPLSSPWLSSCSSSSFF